MVSIDTKSQCLDTNNIIRINLTVLSGYTPVKVHSEETVSKGLMFDSV